MTNIFHATNSGLIRCYTKFKLSNKEKELKLNTHGLTIDQIIFITESKSIEINWTTAENISTEDFKPSLYSELHALSYNTVINTPDEILPEEEYVLRINYTFLNDLNVLRTIKNSKCSEVFCIPAFPQLKGYNENIESIYIHKEDKTIFAPGLLTKKAKIGQNIFVTNVTQHITHSPFVVGNFKVTDISYNNIKCKIYTPPAYGIEAELKADINLVCQHVADNFLMEELNIKIVFMYAECMTVSENAIYFPMSIFPMAGIDQNMHVREKICEFIAKLLTLNVHGHDFWLEVGIKEYIKTSLIRCIFGENEVQYRSKQDLDFVMNNDVYEPSLIKEKNKGKRSNLHKYYNYNFDVSDNFKMIKARLIFHVLENNLSRAFMEKIIYNILKMTSINTCDFTRIVKDISGYDMASFFNYYVYRPGLMNVHLKFDKDKKGKVDVFMTQQSTSNRKNANKRVFGEFLFKVFEQEGVFEYKFTGEKLSFQCHFRTKKRKTEKEMIEQQRSYGKFVELPTENIEEDEHCNMQSQILFMRADPNFHMLARFYIEQPDFMYIEQLLLEKSVYAQIDAIKALSNKISGDSVQALERILNDTHIFYKIRIYIMHMFSQYAVERCDDKSGYEMSGDSSANYDFGYQKIIQYFIKKFCIPGSTIPKANDFVFMSTYFIQKNSSTALVSTNPESQKRFSDRVVKAKNIISAFLANILRFNSTEENVTVRTNFDKFMDQNYVSHGNYLASIIENMTYQLCSNSQIELDPLIAEFERLKLTDLVFPSYQNLISSSVLKTYLRLCFYGFIKLNSKAIIQYSAKNNFVSVREAAFDILCICYLNSSFEYLKEVITKDTKHIKLYILNTIKNILQLKDGKFYGNEEYNDAFNLLADINISYQQKFNYKSRYGVLFDNCSFFLQLLQEYYFDNCMMEILTDIVYLLHDRINVYADDEETAEIEQDSFIIKMRINSLVRLRCLDDVKYEFKHEIKKHDELMAKETFVKEKSEFIIQLTKLDSITVQYDDNIHKYYNSLADYKRKLLVAKNKDMKTLSISMGSKTESEMYTTETVSKSVTDDDNDLLQSKEIKVIDNHDDVEQEENQRYSIVKKLLRNGRIYIENFNFSDFMLHVINKNVKKHKYYPKLNLKIAIDLEAQEYREFLHKQFSEFYITQKLGSHLYLNAKALENVIEGLYLEYNTFEPYILIDENLKQKCMIVLDAIYADSRSMYFAENIESTPTSLHNYNDIIRIPIHLNLIKQRLLDDKMVFLEVFVKYIELIFLNAMEYNDKESEIHNIAEAMLVKSRKLVLLEILPLLIENEEALHGVIASFTDNIFNGSSFIFNNPAIYSLIAKIKNYECVYSVLKTITEDLMTLKESAQYIEPNTSYEYVRSVKKPMYINKIHEKILRESYVSIGHILNDMNLIIRNCIAFNGNSSWVVRVAKKMENHFKKEIALTFGTRYILSSKKSDANTNK